MADTGTSTAPGLVTISWEKRQNEQGRPMIWLGSWLVAADGIEGDWFYSGAGGEATAARPPDEAIGIRIRCWPSEGLDAEYVDLDLDSAGEIDTRTLDFDAPQPYSRLQRHET